MKPSLMEVGLDIAKVLVLALGAYLIGGLPSSAVIQRGWAVDLRREGSGNPGAGNAVRTAGLAAGATLALFDGLKGLVTVLVGRAIGLSPLVLVIVGLAVVLGNNWPILRSERGGRGLAASVGVIVAFAPSLILWPLIWSVAGWRLGGGIAGFFGWGLLPVYASLVGSDTSSLVLTIGLAGFMMARRAQGNGGFETAGLHLRVLFDRDHRPTTAPLRPLAVGPSGSWIVFLLVIGFPTYLWLVRALIGGASIGRFSLGLLAGACLAEFTAKWMFGELFREGVIASGGTLSRSAAFRAALVGTGVARLIPAGGAITPIAMAWSVGDESSKTSGAALRATTLNYGGLAFATGAGLLWVNARFPQVVAPRLSIVAGVTFTALGAGLMLFSGRLRRLVDWAPDRFRERLDRALVDHHMTRRTWGLLTARVLLEALTLGLSLASFGVSLSPSRTVTAFGASQLIGGLPGTPGGLGYTEAGLFGILGYFGISAAAVVAPVVAFRVVSYWLPAVGGVMAGGNRFMSRRRMVRLVD